MNHGIQWGIVCGPIHIRCQKVEVFAGRSGNLLKMYSKTIYPPFPPMLKIYKNYLISSELDLVYIYTRSFYIYETMKICTLIIT